MSYLTTAGTRPAPAGGTSAPVIILSYAHSGAQVVQQDLSADSDLACTMGTGILPLCEAAAATWSRVDDQQAGPMSQLAQASIRSMVNAQLTVVLSAAGHRRWCELATSPPSAAQTFLELFPQTRFVCVHRSCPAVIADCIRAQPWGITSPPIRPYAIIDPGNSVAAVAAYWSSATDQLLAFEAANPGSCSRVRYEDVAADPQQALCCVRSSLQLGHQAAEPQLADSDAATEAAAGHLDGSKARVPAGLVPAGLRDKIDRLHRDLGYTPLSRSLAP